MLKVEVKDGNINTLIAGGSLMEITSDICAVINQVYLSVKEQNGELADMMKAFFLDKESADALFCTPEELEEKTKDIKRKAESRVDELNREIEKFTDFLKQFTDDDETEYITH